MTDSKKTIPTELSIWIYENNELVNLEDVPYNSGDTQAIEEGIRQTFDCNSYWIRGDYYFDVDLVCDLPEEGPGILKCMNSETGEPTPFPEDWYENNINKRFMLNDPDEMEPILTMYYHPWKYRVEFLLTDKKAPTPALNLPPSEKDKKKMSKESQLIQNAINSMSKMGIITEGNQPSIRDILKKLASEIKTI